MINIEPRHFAIIKSILEKYNYNFYLFGSRLKNTAKKFSDVDIFYNDDIPLKILGDIEEAFENSDLPYKVDLVNYNTCAPAFKKILLSDHLCIQQREK